MRYPKTDVTIAGMHIPAESKVLVGLPATSFDPRHFDDPEIFDIGREEKPHLAFSHGPHYCIGVEPARLELKVVFGSIFQRFPALRLAVAPKELKLRTSSTASTCCLLALDGVAKSNRLDAVVIARYIADLPTLEMRIDPLREKPIRQHRKICSSGGTPTAVA